MKVLIVSKSRMKSGASISAITERGDGIRLVRFNNASHYEVNREYQVGDVWEISVARAPRLIRPHLEDFMVYKRLWLAPAKNLIGSIERLMQPRKGHPCVLYNGLLKSTRRDSGALYIAAKSGVPSYSTTFWRPDQPLARAIEGARVRFYYPSCNGGYTFRFVGVQKPLEIIPAESLLCVSLANWWRQKNRPGEELRCYAQLSGWILEKEQTLVQNPESFAERTQHNNNHDAATRAGRAVTWRDEWTPDNYDYQNYEEHYQEYEEYDGAVALLVHSLFSDDDEADCWMGPGKWE